MSLNVENFHNFLSEPGNLHRIKYRELKSLVAEYPYSAKLRLLLLLKSKMDNHPEFSRNLKLAATYLPNRTVLYDLLHDPKLLATLQKAEEKSEEVLELKDLTEVQTLLERQEEEELPAESVAQKLLPPEESWNPTKKEETTWTADIFKDEDEPNSGNTFMSIDALIDSISDEEQKDQESEDEIGDDLLSLNLIHNFTVETMSDYSKMLDKFDLTNDSLPLEIENNPSPLPEKRRFTPQPKDSFAGWLKQIEEDLNRELEVPDINKNLEEVEKNLTLKPEKKKKKKKKKDKRNKVEDFAAKSLSLKEEVVSETLANLLVKQERYDKAIEMYQKLILKYPDKKSIFAAQIDKLKNI